MRHPRFRSSAFVALAVLVASPWALAGPDVAPGAAVAVPMPAVAGVPTIQLAICLDTSGSMEGLIDQARTRIWDIVNTLSTARYQGQVPQLQVALYQYGSDELPASEGFMTLRLPFTGDLDAISEKLFELKANGSSEYCGQVIDSAVKQLSWAAPAPVDGKADAVQQGMLRLVVIAGNEEFTQGPVDYRTAVGKAKERRVLVNTIYCGAYSEGERTGWLNGAYLSGGRYNAIDQGVKMDVPVTPQDAELMKLNERLNETYVPYGSRGAWSQQRQTTQDAANYAAAPAAAAARVASKGNAQVYRNAGWDLVDALEDKAVELEKVPTSDLPDEMRPMTLEQRREFVAGKRAERARLRAEIARVSAERTAWLRERRAKPAGRETLDSAIIKDVVAQAAAAGFAFSKD